MAPPDDGVAPWAPPAFDEDTAQIHAFLEQANRKQVDAYLRQTCSSESTLLPLTLKQAPAIDYIHAAERPPMAQPTPPLAPKPAFAARPPRFSSAGSGRALTPELVQAPQPAQEPAPESPAATSAAADSFDGTTASNSDESLREAVADSPGATGRLPNLQSISSSDQREDSGAAEASAPEPEAIVADQQQQSDNLPYLAARGAAAPGGAQQSSPLRRPLAPLRLPSTQQRGTVSHGPRTSPGRGRSLSPGPRGAMAPRRVSEGGNAHRTLDRRDTSPGAGGSALPRSTILAGPSDDERRARLERLKTMRAREEARARVDAERDAVTMAARQAAEEARLEARRAAARERIARYHEQMRKQAEARLAAHTVVLQEVSRMHPPAQARKPLYIKMQEAWEARAAAEEAERKRTMEEEVRVRMVRPRHIISGEVIIKAGKPRSISPGCDPRSRAFSPGRVPSANRQRGPSFPGLPAPSPPLLPPVVQRYISDNGFTPAPPARRRLVSESGAVLPQAPPLPPQGQQGGQQQPTAARPPMRRRLVSDGGWAPAPGVVHRVNQMVWAGGRPSDGGWVGPHRVLERREKPPVKKESPANNNKRFQKLPSLKAVDTSVPEEPSAPSPTPPPLLQPEPSEGLNFTVTEVRPEPTSLEAGVDDAQDALRAQSSYDRRHAEGGAGGDDALPEITELRTLSEQLQAFSAEVFETSSEGYGTGDIFRGSAEAVAAIKSGAFGPPHPPEAAEEEYSSDSYSPLSGTPRGRIEPLQAPAAEVVAAAQLLQRQRQQQQQEGGSAGASVNASANASASGGFSAYWEQHGRCDETGTPYEMLTRLPTGDPGYRASAMVPPLGHVSTSGSGLGLGIRKSDGLGEIQIQGGASPGTEVPSTRSGYEDDFTGSGGSSGGVSAGGGRRLAHAGGSSLFVRNVESVTVRGF